MQRLPLNNPIPSLQPRILPDGLQCFRACWRKKNLDRPVTIFRGLSISTYFVFDGDSHAEKKAKKEAKSRSHRYLCLAGGPVEDFPKTQVHKAWAVFEKDLGSTIQGEVGVDNFLATRNHVAAELGYDDSKRVHKNMEGAAWFIEILYEKNCRVPTLEKIVDNVTDLTTNRAL